MTDEEFKSKIEANMWEDNLDEVVETIKSFTTGQKKWTWIRNTDCKYISLRIDMRDGAFVLLDRDGNRISLDKLKQQ